MESIGNIFIDGKLAKNFARQFDPTPAHLSGQGNAALPDKSISGLYLLALLMPRLVTASPGLLCASSMTVRWKLPVVEGDRLELSMKSEDFLGKRNVLVHVSRDGTLVATAAITQLMESTS